SGPLALDPPPLESGIGGGFSRRRKGEGFDRPADPFAAGFCPRRLWYYGAGVDLPGGRTRRNSHGACPGRGLRYPWIPVGLRRGLLRSLLADSFTVGRAGGVDLRG